MPNCQCLYFYAQADYRNTTPASSYQQQKLRVCEVCSAYLGIHDNDRRLADHFGGKLHVGFLILREKLDELRVMNTVNLTKDFTRIFQCLLLVVLRKVVSALKLCKLQDCRFVSAHLCTVIKSVIPVQ